MVNTIKVILADDHEIFRRSLADFLNVRESIEVVGQASNGNDAVEQASQFEPDLVLLDLNMPGRNGFEASKAIKHR
ncbi:MAG TPA: response regulator transcription factor, partial [Bacteroidota bacterium]|nr:response regulator transcription factor [Bacteroidota bacterium]